MEEGLQSGRPGLELDTAVQLKKEEGKGQKGNILIQASE